MSEPSQQQPRSTADLIRELEAEAEFCTTVALAVGFENTTLFVFSGANDNLKTLNDMVLAGGEPIGLLRYHSHEDGHVTIACRTLEEYAVEPWAQDYLESLTRKFADLLVRDHGGRIAS